MSLPNKQYTRLGPVGYTANLNTALLTPATGESIHVGKVILSNRSGGAIDVGFGYKVPQAECQVFKFTAGTPNTLANVTSNAFSTTANTWNTIVTTTNSDGFVIQCAERFNAFGVTIDTAGGTAGTVVYYVSNGSGWSSSASLQIQALGLNATGYKHTVFAPTEDWAPGCGETGTDSTQYQMLFKWTTAPTTTAPKGSALKVFRLAEFYPQLADKSEVAEDFGGGEMIAPAGTPIVAYFGGTANANNLVRVDYRLR